MKRTAGLNVVWLFIAGISVGALADDLYHRMLRDYWWEQESPARFTETVRQLARQLSLTDNQQAAVEPIVGRAYFELLELRLSHQPEVERIVTHTITQLNNHLDPDQQDELGEIYAQIQNHWYRSRRFLEQSGISPHGHDRLPPGQPTQEARATTTPAAAAPR